MSREEGIKLVQKYDHVEPSDMEIFLKNAKISRENFFKIIDKFRDGSIWEKKQGKWIKKDCVSNYKKSVNIVRAAQKLKKSSDKLFIKLRKNLIPFTKK